jgi:hypothetical protein
MNWQEAEASGRAREAARMGLTAFNPESSTNGTPDAGRDLPEIRASDPEDKTRAVADLLHNKVLSHTVGGQGGWEVRTTLTAGRQAWRYRSSVFVHGKETGGVFPPIEVDRTRQIRQAEAVTEEMLAAFAREAVEVHSVRCASIAEYHLMASIYSQPRSRHHWAKKAALVFLSVAALAAAYWLWGWYNGLSPRPPQGKPPAHSVRWQQLQVAYNAPRGEPFMLPLPTLERTPQGIPVDVTLEASGDRPGWLQLDRERLHIRGTPPLTAQGQTYRLIVRAHGEQGSDSRLLVLLTITGQPDQTPPTPRLRGHWAW